MLFVLVALGCGFGGVCRYLGMTAINRRVGEAFPWGTLVVNVIGSFFLGIILGSGLGESEASIAFLGIGFCGGLTTFSTFSLQNLTLLSKQEKGKLAVNIGGSVLLCVGLVWLGFVVSERFFA